MAGTRQPTALVEAKGKKHLTKAETAQRKAREPKPTVPKTAVPPKWLAEPLRKDFRAIGKQLIDLGIYSKLDADALGRYLMAQHQWLIATQMAEKALTRRKASGIEGVPPRLDPDMDEAESWGRIQERYFKQARNCANDLGLTITSRCRLVLPEGAGAKEPPNPVLELLKRKEERAANG